MRAARGNGYGTLQSATVDLKLVGMPASAAQPQRSSSPTDQERGTPARNAWVRWLAVGAAAAVLACQLLAPPIVGVADNGDFSKLIGKYGLRSPAYWEYIGVGYPHDASLHYDPGFSSSEQIFVRAAIGLNRLAEGAHSLDIRAAGLVHSAVFLLAVGLFAPLLAGGGRAVQLVFYAAALFIFTDVMYVSYFNSLYMDVSALIGLLLAAVFYLRAITWGRGADAWLFVASSVILISSKPQARGARILDRGFGVGCARAAVERAQGGGGGGGRSTGVDQLDHVGIRRASRLFGQ